MKPIGMVSNAIGNAASLAYLIVFAVTLYDVGMRYVFNSPTIWGLELVIALAGIQYVMGGAQAMRDDAHVRIDFVYQLLPKKTRTVLDVVSSVITIALLSVILFYGFRQAEISWLRGETSGAGWNSHAPMIMKIAIPLGAALMLIQAIEILFEKCSEVLNAR